MYFLYVVHFTLFVGAIHWSVGKLLSKHPRISLIVLSMSAPGRTPCWRSMETRSCSKLNSLSSFEFCFWHILVTERSLMDGWSAISWQTQYLANIVLTIESVSHLERIMWWRKEDTLLLWLTLQHQQPASHLFHTCTDSYASPSHYFHTSSSQPGSRYLHTSFRRTATQSDDNKLGRGCLQAKGAALLQCVRAVCS